MACCGACRLPQRARRVRRPADIRRRCRALAGGLARQIKAREETDAYRERVRLRTFEDDIVALLSREGSLNHAISNHLDEFMKMLSAMASPCCADRIWSWAAGCPPEADVRALATWADRHGRARRCSRPIGWPSTTPAARQASRVAAGVLAVTMSMNEPWIVLWLRAEQVEVVNWAGNPHKNVNLGPGGQLNAARQL